MVAVVRRVILPGPARRGSGAESLEPWTCVARSTTGVRERTSGFRNELPVVARRVQRQLQDPESIGVDDLAVRNRGADRFVLSPARTDDDLADSVHDRVLIRVLRREALVLMVVAVEHYVGTGVVQVVPPISKRVVAAVGTGAEPRFVPVRERAKVLVCGQVVLEPYRLRRPRAAAAHG